MRFVPLAADSTSRLQSLRATTASRLVVPTSWPRHANCTVGYLKSLWWTLMLIGAVQVAADFGASRATTSPVRSGWLLRR